MKLFTKSKSLILKSFTLIELLIVIVIIGVLSTALIPRIKSIQAQARDTRRLADVRTIQNALEMYYMDHGAYPKINAWSYSASGTSEWNSSIVGSLSSYLVLPFDPINNIRTHYRYYGNIGNTYACDGLPWSDYQYTIVFKLELPNDLVKNSNYSSFNKCVHGPLRN